MSAKWIKTKISSLAADMTDGPFGSDLKMVHYTDKREARIVQLSNVGEDGWLDENIKYTTFKHAHEIGRCIIEPGNIIVAKMMPAGRAILCPNHEPMFVQGSDVVQIVPNNKIDSTFFVYMTKQNDYLKQIERNTQGSTRARTSISKLKEIIFTIPESIETQKKLAEILSTCDAVIQNTQKTIEKYKAIKQGMMQDLFTRGLTKDGKLRSSYEEAPELYKQSELGMIPKEWEVKELKVLCGSIGDGLHGTPNYESNTEIYFINGNNLDNGMINLDSAEEISEYSYQKNYVELSDNTVLLSINGTIGNTAFYNGEKVLLGKSAAYINTKNIDKLFLRYFIQTEYFTKFLNKVLTGSTIQNLSLDSIRKMPVIDCDEQIAIAKRLSSIDSTIQKEEAILAKYKNIKTGLMARLLTPPEDAQIIDETGE